MVDLAVGVELDHEAGCDKSDKDGAGDKEDANRLLWELRSCLDSIGDKYGLGTPWGLHLAEMEGGAGDEALEVGKDVAGDTVGVVVGLVKSGWDTELVQTRLDNLESFLWGNIGTL